MSKCKKFFIVMLSFLLSLSIMPVHTDAGQNVKLNKSELTLFAGNSANLRVKNSNAKVRWSSSNISVATVTQSGKVNAKSQGSCKITAKTASKKLVCRVTVKKKSSSVKKNVTYVYVTDTGSKYHRASCRYLWNSQHRIKLSSAKSLGYTACSVCW